MSRKQFQFTVVTALGFDLWTLTDKVTNVLHVEAPTQEEAMDKVWDDVDALYAGNPLVISHLVTNVYEE